MPDLDSAPSESLGAWRSRRLTLAEAVAELCHARLSLRNARDIADLRAAVEYVVSLPPEHHFCRVVAAPQPWYESKLVNNPGHGLGQPGFH